MCLLVKTKDHENIMILLLKVLYFNVHFLKSVHLCGLLCQQHYIICK